MPPSVFAAVALLSALACTCHAQSKTLRLLDCTIDSVTLEDCNANNYFIRVGIFAAPGILIFVILWLMCPLYCAGKYCCNCCGGRKQTPNCCCPDMKYPARYSKGDLLRPRVFGFIALMLAGAGLGWGATGIINFIDGLSTLKNVFVAMPTSLQNAADQIESAMIIKTYSASAGTYVTTNLYAASSLKNVTLDVKTSLQSNIDAGAKKFEEYMGYFSKGIAALFAIPVGLIFIAQIFSLCSCRTCLPMTIVWFLFLFGGLLWLGHGIFSGLSMIMGDTCAEVYGLANQQTNVLPVVLQCKDSIFDDFRNTFKGIEQSRATLTCETLMAHCYDSTQSAYLNVAAGNLLTCPPAASINCTAMTFGSLYTLIQTTFTLSAQIATVPGAVTGGYYCHTTAPCTLQACSSECLLGGASGLYRGPSGNYTLEAYSSFTAANQVANAIDTVGAQYSNCDSVIGILMNPVAKPCSPISDGLVFARQSSGVEGLGVIVALFSFAWGAKRFIPLDDADKPQMDGREMQDLDEDGLK